MHTPLLSPEHNVDSIEGQCSPQPLRCTGMGGEAVKPFQKRLGVDGTLLLLLRAERRSARYRVSYGHYKAIYVEREGLGFKCLVDYPSIGHIGNLLTEQVERASMPDRPVWWFA